MAEVKSKNTRKRVIIALVIFFGLIVLSLGGVFVGVAVYGAYASPEAPFLQKLVRVPVLKYAIPAEKRGRVLLSFGLDVLKDADKRSELIDESFNFDGSVEVEARAVRSVGDIKGTLNYSGAKNADAIEISNNLSLNIGGVLADAEAEEYLDGESLFLRLNSFPEMILGASANFLNTRRAMPQATEIVGQWYRVDISSQVNADVDEDEFAGKLAYLLDEENANFVGLSEIRGVSTFHFSYNVSASELKRLVGYGKNSSEFDIDALRIEIWFDDDGDVFKMALFAEVTDKDNTKISCSASLEIWDIGSAANISEPTDYKEWDELSI